MKIHFPNKLYSEKSNSLLKQTPKLHPAKMLLWEIMLIKGFFSFPNHVINLLSCKDFQC